MMKYLRKLPNYRRQPSGLEWVILKKLPIFLLGGTAIPLFVSIGSRLYPQQGTAIQIAEHLTGIDILSIATAVTVWMAGFIVAIGCFVVVLMKGPAYVADAYPLSDSEQPITDKARIHY